MLLILDSKSNLFLYKVKFLLLWIVDQESEKMCGMIYVSRDEEFSEIKNLSFYSNVLYSVLHIILHALEISSAAYKQWQFDFQGLPNELMTMYLLITSLNCS